MNIQQEPSDAYTIQSYSDETITVQAVTYQTSTLITPSRILTDWNVQTIQQLSVENLEPILAFHPELMIIGHGELGKYPPPSLIQFLYEKRIGIESMSIGAACRTFNVLLSEHRQVVLGFIPKV